jgi:hemerythrin superfamily protein
MAHQLMKELHKDHQEVKSIFKQLIKTEDSSKRKQICSDLQEELIPHMKAEETAVYPKLMDKKASKEHALEGLEEHRAAEMVLKDLLSLDPGDEKFKARATVLKEMIEHHIEEEEEKIFDDLESKGKDELDQIFSQFEEEKERLKSEVTA